MKKTAIFYGSSTGTTEAVANLIASKLGIAPADVHDAGKPPQTWQAPTTS